MFSSYPFNVEYEVGDLIMLAHSVEYMRMCASVGEIGIIIKLYDKNYSSHDIYDCRVILKCGGELDCWFGELINLCKLKVDKEESK